jgi:hypothetical protein
VWHVMWNATLIGTTYNIYRVSEHHSTIGKRFLMQLPHRV